jgi:hypothetical protein
MPVRTAIVPAKLRWQAGVFVFESSPSTIERAAAEAAAD